MLHRLLDTVRGLNSKHGMQSFYNEVLSHGNPGAPTVEEAKKDYTAMMRARNERISGI